MCRKIISLFLGFLILIPSGVMAGPTIPGFYGGSATPLPVVAPNTLPSPRGFIQGVDRFEVTSNRAVIYQNQPKAIIDWNTFDVGKDASVHFDQQKNSNWAALNRIWDKNPSQIFGTLTADGHIYLINQNGILFGPGSKVNVHSLIASSLNMPYITEWLEKGRLIFGTSTGYLNGQPDLFYDPSKSPGTISNHGAITTDNMGSVFLIGPRVENAGTIVSPMGQIGLVAGTELELALPVSDTGDILFYTGGQSRTSRMIKMTNTPEGSVAWNMEGGYLEADTGLVGMYGRIVNQDGLIRSVTAVQQAGHVELFASEKITTGPKSLITLPVSDSSDKIHTSFATAQSDLTLSGLDPISPSQPVEAVKRIELRGLIDAPSGLVTLHAVDRVYLDTGSRIDVSGLWINKSSRDGLLDVQMNSSNLRDEFMQKGGVLQGQTVRISSINGSSIGDVSGAFSSEGLTALERHTTGGNVFVKLTGPSDAGTSNGKGDFIIKEGASVDFSGGGFRYGAGSLNTTKLMSGTKVYDISNADPKIHYDKILTEQNIKHDHFGLTEKYTGLYYGGSSPVKEYVQAHIVGNDAGSLSLQARQVVLDGAILGRVERGLLQYMTSNPLNALGNQTKSGYREPTGGSLMIGNTEVGNNTLIGDNVDFLIREIVVKPQNSILPQSFQPDDTLDFSKTILSADSLSNSGLSRISLATNTSLTIEQGAKINLIPGGSFVVRARKIEHYGDITAPGGSIKLGLETNVTTNTEWASGSNPEYVPLNERIYLAGGSRLSVAGEQVDNSSVGIKETGKTISGHLNGGTIEILDKTVTGEGVAIARGALVDVSGGYQIDVPNKITGGDAGSVAIQGYSLIVNGDLRAHSLVGRKGGSISMHAGKVSVVDVAPSLPGDLSTNSPWPDNFEGLRLGQDQLDSSGFTSIQLMSVNDIEVQAGVKIGPSLWKMAQPVPGQIKRVGGAASTMSTSVRATQDDVTSSAIAMTAGTIPRNLTAGQQHLDYPMNPVVPNLFAKVSVMPGATLQVAPGGSVQMTGPYINVDGSVRAPAGKITMAAVTDLTIGSRGEILAEGYNRLASAAVVKGLPLDHRPLSGGTITLSAGNDLVLSPGSLVDVSGSVPLASTVRETDTAITYNREASNAGSIAFKSLNLELNGSIVGKPGNEGLQGGTLSVEKTDVNSTLSLSTGDLAKFRDGGFDALVLKSAGGLNLTGSGEVNFARQLTMDTPVVSGSGSERITLSAPWLQVTNANRPTILVPVLGNSEIRLLGIFLDVTGDIAFSGFKNVELSATRDIRFSDALYTVSSNPVWSGLLRTPGDVSLVSGRVYPTTLSSFVIQSGGKATILPYGSPADSPIYSAAGSLTIKAGGGIEHQGYLAAPMGVIDLQATGDAGRVYLGGGSVTKTSASLPVKYGDIQQALGENIWGIEDKNNPNANVPYKAVGSSPSKSISITGEEVVVREGAAIDTSGGGAVFAYQFLSWTSGTVNPLQKTGRYVIMPDNSIVLPGKAIYLSGVAGLKPGAYSLLPAEFAFLPGAMVVTDLGTSMLPGDRQKTKEGYTVTSGYDTNTGTGIRSGQLKGYEVRPAVEVLKEGYFAIQVKQGGDAGQFVAAGNTTIMDGSIKANALKGFSGGSIALSGSNVTVSASAIPLPSGFEFSTALPTELVGKLNIAGSAISGKGFSTIGLGFTDLEDPVNSIVASQVTVKEGVAIEAGKVILAAKDQIRLEPGTQVTTLASPGNSGEATILSPSGKVVLGEGSVIHASNAVNLHAADFDLRGNLLSDNSTLNLKGSKITFVRDDFVRSSNDVGLFLTETQWRGLSGFEDIGLISTSDILFRGNFDLAVQDVLTIDAGRIMGLDTGSTVRLSAPTVHLLNTSGTTAAPGITQLGQMTVESIEMAIGKGNILFDTFSSINLNAQNNLTFKGAGALQTGGGDLNITSARITTSYSLEPAAPAGSKNATLSPIYTVANIDVDAGTTGVIRMLSGTGTPGATETPGGTLDIKGKNIEVATRIEIPSGQLKLAALDNVVMKNGAQILARGTDYTPGGLVSLISTNGGAVNMEAGSIVDVSSGTQGKAGSISLYAPVGGTLLAGDLRGTSNIVGQGGSFAMVTRSVEDFASLNSKLASGGFNNVLDIRARSGDLTIAAGEIVRARQVKLTADAGSINLSGAIDVNQPAKGGMAELYAKQDLSISGTILARGTGTNAPGGAVSLGVDTGVLAFGGGSIDVSGSGAGTGGAVAFRSQLSGPGFDILNVSLSGTLTGASSVVVEAVRTYTDLYPSITLDAMNAIQTDISAFMNSNAGSLKTNLLANLSGVNSDQFHLRPGIVVQQTTGDIRLDQDWDLTNLRYGDEPGTVTLRAAGNININGNVIDNPTNDYTVLRSDVVKPSWNINLIAGAQTDSADLMAVRETYQQGSSQGTLSILPQKVIYSESGSIRFASGRDTIISESPSNNFMVAGGMRYSLASYSGSIMGKVLGDLTMNPSTLTGVAMQSATGNIDLEVGGNLYLNKAGSNLGAIRTTGERAIDKQTLDYYSYNDGGSITLNVGGNIDGNLSNAWLTMSPDPSGLQWHRIALPQFGASSTEGIAAMRGGDVYVRAGGTFNAQTGTFGTGNLRIYAGGDLKGRFLVQDGIGEFNAMGNFGVPNRQILSAMRKEPQLIEMFDARVSVTAQGNLELGAVVNPSLSNRTYGSNYWDNGYTTQSAIKLTSVTGDVNIYGSIDPTRYGSFYDENNPRNLILPSSVEISAKRDISINGGQGVVFRQLPSDRGELKMKAGNDIVFSSGEQWVMLDSDIDQVYGLKRMTLTDMLPRLESHAGLPIHQGDPNPVIIQAGRDIIGLNITVPKMTNIRSDRDIIDLNFSGQNIQTTDKTSIVAQRDIRFGYSKNVSSKKLELGGPGSFVVQAAREIDLGNAEGIKAVGNFVNKSLEDTGSSVLVSSGVNRDLTLEEVKDFYAELRNAGTEYSKLQSAGDGAAALERIETARREIVAPFFGTSGNGGDINMTSSQMSTTGGGDLYVIAAGTLNVGKTAINSNQGKSTGIFTSTGGAVSVFAMYDINVNEARVMTFRGGDITIWSDLGDINAGRGSKAVINTGSPVYSCDKATGVCSLKFNPPAVGSGIRALTYDPDDAGPLTAPEPGDAYLFAPQGVIDAGEAGISGGNIVLGATAVLNAGNISFSAGSVGVPTQSEAINLGALTGATSLTEKTALSPESMLGPGQGKDAEKVLSAADDIMKWLEVKVINFDMTAGVVEEEEKR